MTLPDDLNGFQASLLDGFKTMSSHNGVYAGFGDLSRPNRRGDLEAVLKELERRNADS